MSVNDLRDDPRATVIPDVHGHAKGEHKPYADERPIALSARMLFLWFYHAAARGAPRFLMVADHMNYLTFEDPAAVNLVRRALKLAQAGDLHGAADTASVDVAHAAIVSRGLRRGMRYSIGAEVDNDPRSRPDAQNIVDAMKPDGLIRSVHFLPIDHPAHGPNWNWPFDNPEFADLYETVGTERVWELYMETLLDAIERLPGHIVGHFYVPAKFGHWPADDVLEGYEDRLIAAVAERGMAVELNSRFLYRSTDDAERERYRRANMRLLRKAKAAGVGIAVGSDAHSPRDQGNAFVEVLALLDEAEVNELVFPIAGKLARVALRAVAEAQTAADNAAAAEAAGLASHVSGGTPAREPGLTGTPRAESDAGTHEPAKAAKRPAKRAPARPRPAAAVEEVAEPADGVTATESEMQPVASDALAAEPAPFDAPPAPEAVPPEPEPGMAIPGSEPVATVSEPVAEAAPPPGEREPLPPADREPRVPVTGEPEEAETEAEESEAPARSDAAVASAAAAALGLDAEEVGPLAEEIAPAAPPRRRPPAKRPSAARPSRARPSAKEPAAKHASSRASSSKAAPAKGATSAKAASSSKAAPASKAAKTAAKPARANGAAAKKAAKGKAPARGASAKKLGGAVRPAAKKGKAAAKASHGKASAVKRSSKPAVAKKSSAKKATAKKSTAKRSR